MSARFKTFVGLGLALASTSAATWAPAQELGPHGNLLADAGGGCTACHLSASPRNLETLAPERIAVPEGGKARLADPIARFCWMCHRAGNPYGARTLDERALRSAGHGGAVRKVSVARSSWAVNPPQDDPYLAERNETGGGGSATCTTCHDVHDGTIPSFLRKSSPDGRYSALCAGCHPQRENPGLTGGRNLRLRGAYPYSMHPTSTGDPESAGRHAAPSGSGATVRELPSCQTCHDVHRADDPGLPRVAGLLRVGPGASISDLCRRCHAFPAPGDRESHPMESHLGGRLPPEAFASPVGVPFEWRAPRHIGSGATEFAAGKGQAPRCTSCHDLHGGRPSTSLLYGPDVGSRGGGGWCFSCHPPDAVRGLGHPRESAPGREGECESCHGSAPPGLPSRWGAHRDFRTLHPPTPAGPEGPQASAATGEAAARVLVEAMLDPDPAIREIAAEQLPLLKPALDPATLQPALADPRPEVRSLAARTLGIPRDRRVLQSLKPLLADRDAAVRAAAARALARTGDERAADAVLPLLGDSAAEVRRAAIAFFTTLRDARAAGPLLELLYDPADGLAPEALNAVALMNDARVLQSLLAGASRHRPHETDLMRILRGMSDPAALESILSLRRHDHRLVRIAAAEALRRYPQPASLESLIAALREPDSDLSATAIDSLVLLKNRLAFPALIALLQDRGVYEGTRRRAALALAQFAAPSAVPALVDALGDSRAMVREAANSALETMTCRNFGRDQTRWRQWWAEQPADALPGRCR